MKTTLQNLLADRDTAFDTIIHAGAGTGSLLETLRKHAPRQLILLEPNAQLTSLLGPRIKPQNGECLLPAALALQSGKQTLHVFNNSKKSSLLNAGELLEHFPNLKLAADQTVDALTLDDLLAAKPVDANAPNLLILETAGLEKHLLMTANGALADRFSHVLVKTSAAPLYDGELDESSATEHLAEIGYRLSQSDSETLDPYTIALFERDDERIKTRKNTERMAAQDEKLARLEQQLTAASEALAAANKAKDEQAKLAAERQTQVQQLTTARDGETKRANELKAQLDAVTKTRDEQTKLATDLKTQLDAANKAKDEQAKLAADRQTQVQQLTTARDGETKRANELKTQLDAVTKTRDEQTKLATDLKAQLDAANKSKDEQAKLAADRQIQVQQLTTARDGETKRASDLKIHFDATIKARDEQTKLASNLKSQLETATAQLSEKVATIETLQATNLEFEHRQRLLNEEMIKAEAQIELIKDVLLREPGL